MKSLSCDSICRYMGCGSSMERRMGTCGPRRGYHFSLSGEVPRLQAVDRGSRQEQERRATHQDREPGEKRPVAALCHLGHPPDEAYVLRRFQEHDHDHEGNSETVGDEGVGPAAHAELEEQRESRAEEAVPDPDRAEVEVRPYPELFSEVRQEEHRHKESQSAHDEREERAERAAPTRAPAEIGRLLKKRSLRGEGATPVSRVVPEERVRPKDGAHQQEEVVGEEGAVELFRPVSPQHHGFELGDAQGQANRGDQTQKQDDRDAQHVRGPCPLHLLSCEPERLCAQGACYAVLLAGLAAPKRSRPPPMFLPVDPTRIAPPSRSSSSINNIYNIVIWNMTCQGARELFWRGCAPGIRRIADFRY